MSCSTHSGSGLQYPINIAVGENVNLLHTMLTAYICTYCSLTYHSAYTANLRLDKAIIGIIEFLHIMVTFSTYICNACHFCQGWHAAPTDMHLC